MTGLHARVCALSGLIVLVVCVSRCDADVIFQKQLLARIEALEKQGRDQAAKIQDQAGRLESQEKTISEYRERVWELERSVAELKRETKQNPDVSDVPEDRQDGTILATQRSRKHPSGTGKDVTRQRRLLMDNESPVAFNALISENVEVKHLGINQTIVFPAVTTNIGGGYHSHTGVFIAPRAGIFLFSLTLTSFNTIHEEIIAAIQHNGNSLGAAYAHADSGHIDQGSKTAVAQLAAGDEVWVSVTGPADESLWGGEFTSFMGCLVFPM